MYQSHIEHRSCPEEQFETLWTTPLTKLRNANKSILKTFRIRTDWRHLFVKEDGVLWRKKHLSTYDYNKLHNIDDNEVKDINYDVCNDDDTDYDMCNDDDICNHDDMYNYDSDEEEDDMYRR